MKQKKIVYRKIFFIESFNEIIERRSLLTTTWWNIRAEMKWRPKNASLRLHDFVLWLFGIVCNLHLKVQSYFMIYRLSISSKSFFCCLGSKKRSKKRLCARLYELTRQRQSARGKMWGREKQKDNKNMTNCSFVLWNYELK